jgi:hypothetical protein
MPATNESLPGNPRHIPGARPVRLSDLFGTALPGTPGTADEVRESCAQATFRVLRGADQPLTTLDILDELGYRYHCWTSSTVRHTLADLVERGILIERRDLRPHVHLPAGAQMPAQPW